MDNIKKTSKHTIETAGKKEKSPELFEQLKGFFAGKEGEKVVEEKTETTPKLKTPKGGKKEEKTPLKEKVVENEFDEEIKSGFEALYRKFDKTIEDAKKEVSKFADDIDEKLEAVKKDLKKDFEEKIEKPVAQATQEVGEAFDQKINQLGQAVGEKVDEAKQTVDEVVEKADKELEAIKASLEEAAQKGDEFLGEALDTIIDTAEEVQKELTEKVESVSDSIAELIPESLREKSKEIQQAFDRATIEARRFAEVQKKALEMEVKFKEETARTIQRVMPIVQKIAKISSFIDRIRKMLALMALRVKHFYEDIKVYNQGFIQTLKELNINLKKEFLEAFE